MQHNNNRQQKDGNKQPDLDGQMPTLRPREFGSFRGLLWILLLAAAAFWLWGAFSNGEATPAIDYSRFRSELRAGNVERIVVEADRIEGELEEPIEITTADDEVVETTGFVTFLPSFGDEELWSLLEAEEVMVETRPAVDPSSGWLILIVQALPILLLLGLGYLFFRRMQSQGQGLFSVGKSQARLYEQNGERVTFDDVAGVEGTKTELQEIIDYLKDPKSVARLGGEAPKGVLLVGPPGTGKTLLARAVAGEAGVPFFSITGSDFMEMFVGVGASRVRDMFNKAREVAPAIIFIDELDSIGRRRGAGLGGGHDEREQTLNQLLSEMDGFEPSENVIVMAATNRPDILDPALLRPGRFDRQITVDLPTLKAREEILEIHARNKPLAGDVQLLRLARGTPGFSGADLENILNEAALMAARQDKDVIEWEDIEEARDKILMGLEREGLMLTEEERRLIAYHEGGHALVAALLPNADPIHKVSIVPRGRAMGVTQQLPEREKYIYPREYLIDRMAVMMGGRAAEELIFDTSTSGAENDLKQATRLARKMVLDWGMSDRLGLAALGGEKENVFLGEDLARGREYSESTAREVDQEVRAILADAYDRAMTTLRTNRRQLDDLAEALLEREELPGEEVLALLGVSEEKLEDGMTPHEGIATVYEPVEAD